MFEGNAGWVVAAAAGAALGTAGWLLFRSMAGKARRRARADALLTEFCLAAIGFAQDFRLSVQSAAFPTGRLPCPPPFGETMDALALAVEPFPARADILRCVREISDEALRMARGNGAYLASQPAGHWERWAGDREVRVRHFCRVAARARKAAWRDPPVRPAPGAVHAG